MSKKSNRNFKNIKEGNPTPNGKIPSDYDLDEECGRVNGNCSKCRHSGWCDNYDPYFDIEEW